jgi:diphthamide synthase subunit DPH2
MRIFVVCSKHFYHKIPPIKEYLEKKGHKITLPNSYEQPFKEEELKLAGKTEHIKFKQEMMRLHEPKIRKNDAILVLNLEKKGIPNYIGGGTFMEIVKAWELDKKVFFWNPLPKCSFTDELIGINPKIINHNLDEIS